MTSFARGLLDQAHYLALTDAKRPRSANLRRAISASYYALFHQLTETGSELLVGAQNSDWPLVALTTRAFEHNLIKRACQSFPRKPSALLAPLWNQFEVEANVDLQVFAKGLVELQELRHEADYNLALSFGRGDALAAIEQAKEAIQCWERLLKNERNLARLATLVMLFGKQFFNR